VTAFYFCLFVRAVVGTTEIEALECFRFSELSDVPFKKRIKQMLKKTSLCRVVL